MKSIEKVDPEQKEEQLKTELKKYLILAYNRGRAYLASLKREQERQKENEQLKRQIIKMRNCPNCSKKGCNKETSKQRECIDNNHKYWEFAE
jgi:hypothetical protein